MLFMWRKIMTPMYRLRLHGLYGLYGPHSMSPERLLNLVTHALTLHSFTGWWWFAWFYWTRWHPMPEVMKCLWILECYTNLPWETGECIHFPSQVTLVGFISASLASCAEKPPGWWICAENLHFDLCIIYADWQIIHKGFPWEFIVMNIISTP